MLDDNVIAKINPYDLIQGYTSDINCDICSLDIMVKMGTIRRSAHLFVTEVGWALCHICYDKGWNTPAFSPDGLRLIYIKRGTEETKEVVIDFGDTDNCC